MTTLATFYGGPLADETRPVPDGPDRPLTYEVGIWTPLPCWSPDVALSCRVARYRLRGGGGGRVRYVYEGSRREVPV